MTKKTVKKQASNSGGSVCDKYRVGVLMGGKSIEREVSFNSGRTVCDHIDTSIYDVIPVFQKYNGDLYLLPWHFLHRGKIEDFIDRLDHEAKKITWDELKKHVDFVYVAVHGRYAEDGTLQGMLEVLGIPYLGSKLFGSSLGMNKVTQKEILKSNSIAVPNGIVVRAHEIDNPEITYELLAKRLEQVHVALPCIVKPSCEGSSLGVSVVHEVEQLLPAIKKASMIDARQAQDVIVEEKIEGMEFVCVCLQKSLESWFSFPITEVVTEKGSELFDYEQKYMPGRALKITPARCKKKEQDAIVNVCQQVCRALNFCTIGRVDGILTKDGRVVIIDPNSLTGMDPATFLFHQAAEFGMSHAQLINFLIERELHAYGISPIVKNTKKEGGVKSMSEEKKKMRVAVLLGGESHEREISLESGRNVCYKLAPNKYDVIPVFVNDNMELFKLSQKILIKNSTRSINKLITPDMQISWSDLPDVCDFVFLGLHGGKGEGGVVQGALEMLGLPYNGSGVLTSALCQDKYKTNELLKSKGFDVPKARLLEKSLWEKLSGQDHKKQGSAQKQKECDDFLTEIVQDVGLPCIVKPHDDGCSILVQRASNKIELKACIEKLFDVGKDTALIEECVRGMEITGGVYGNDEATALPPSQSVAQEDILSIKEKFLPGAGKNLTPAPLSEKVLQFIQKTLQDVYILIGCKGYVRIDCFYQHKNESPTGKERVVILEINTLPALTPATCLFHQAAEVGVKPMQFIDIIVELGVSYHAKQRVRDGSKKEAQNMTFTRKVFLDKPA